MPRVVGTGRSYKKGSTSHSEKLRQKGKRLRTQIGRGDSLSKKLKNIEDELEASRELVNELLGEKEDNIAK